MTRLGLAIALVVGGMVAGAGAQAMPMATASSGDSAIVQVAQGCGPGGHRNGYGRCVPNFARGFQGCPPGFHRNPYGRCRPN